MEIREKSDAIPCNTLLLLVFGQWVRRERTGYVPWQSRRAWYQSRTRHQPERIQANRQHAVQADTAAR